MTGRRTCILLAMFVLPVVSASCGPSTSPASSSAAKDDTSAGGTDRGHEWGDSHSADVVSDSASVGDAVDASVFDTAAVDVDVGDHAVVDATTDGQAQSTDVMDAHLTSDASSSGVDVFDDSGKTDAIGTAGKISLVPAVASWNKAFGVKPTGPSSSVVGDLPKLTGGLIEDLDGDGDNDIAVWNEDGVLWLYLWQGGASKLIELKLGVGNQRVFAASVVRHPMTGLSLIVAGSRLWRVAENNGVWGVQDVWGQDTSLGDSRRHTITVADVDADGMLDLLVPRKDCANYLLPEVWVAQADGSYVDKAADWKLGVAGGHWQAILTDVDGDADSDLVWLHHACNKAGTQGLWLREGRDSQGVPLYVRKAPHPLFVYPTPMFPFASPNSVTSADLNNDGKLDLVVTSHGVAYTASQVQQILPPAYQPYLGLAKNLLLLGDSGQLWKDASELWGMWKLKDPVKGLDMVAWGVGAADLDLDGMVDLVINHGEDSDSWVKKNKRGPHRPVVLRNVSGALQEVSSGLPTERRGRSLALGDADNDGAVDVLLGGMGEAPALFVNTVKGPWLGVRLKGLVSNSMGYGAKVILHHQGGSQLREVGVAGGFGAPHSSIAMFGLSGTSGPVKILVQWPTGRTQQYEGLPTHQVVTLEEHPWLQVQQHVLLQGQTAQVTAAAPPNMPSATSLELDWLPQEALSWKQPWTCDGQGKCNGVLQWGAKALTGMIARLRLKVDGQALKVWPSVTLK